MELFTTTQKRIIELLLEDNKTLPELVSALSISKPATSKHLKQLAELNIVKGTYERNSNGRTIRYSLQPFHIVFSINPQLKTTLNFKADAVLDTNYLLLGSIPQQEFRHDLKHYLQHIKQVRFTSYVIILFGSVAQGIAHRKSDIDFLILKETWTKNDKEQILQQIAQATLFTTHQAKPLVLTTKQFNTIDTTLKKEIIDNGVIIYEQGDQWDGIKQKLRKYKTITI